VLNEGNIVIVERSPFVEGQTELEKHEKFCWGVAFGSFGGSGTKVRTYFRAMIMQ